MTSFCPSGFHFSPILILALCLLLTVIRAADHIQQDFSSDKDRVTTFGIHLKKCLKTAMNGLDLLSLLCGSLARRTNCRGSIGFILQFHVVPPWSHLQSQRSCPVSRSVLCLADCSVFRTTFSSAPSIFVLSCGSYQTPMPIDMVCWRSMSPYGQFCRFLHQNCGFHANATP